ncbi:MAG: hypothetical protein HC937_03805, partial [Aquincola sp.]|nr:hypothetical protein [Aquincola sp.]
ASVPPLLSFVSGFVDTVGFLGLSAAHVAGDRLIRRLQVLPSCIPKAG